MGVPHRIIPNESKLDHLRIKMMFINFSPKRNFHEHGFKKGPIEKPDGGVSVDAFGDPSIFSY